MDSSKDLLAPYGTHRVISPVGALPQGAQKLDNSPEIKSDYEMLLDVDYLMLDATSMRKIRETCADDLKSMAKQICDIVQERGKMHNPVTHSGGVLLGRIKEIGARFFSLHSTKEGNNILGQRVIPVASLSTLPLRIKKIKDISGDSISVEAQAIAFACMQICPVPTEFAPKLALSCIDISSLVPQVQRCVEDLIERRRKIVSSESEAIRVLVMGCGKAGVTALYCLRKLSANLGSQGINIQVLAIDSSAKRVDWIMKNALADEASAVDARKAYEVHEFVHYHTGGSLCDLLINVVNIPNTETATVLCSRKETPRGTILWFSMATQFDRAALATDSLGKDVTMLIGNGVAESQVDEIFSLVKDYPELRKYLEAGG
jgi:L-erythro-3,5-diaminohexanoate dehydrogenase